MVIGQMVISKCELDIFLIQTILGTMLVEVVFHACIFGIVLLYLLQAIVISIYTINIYNNYGKSRRFIKIKITQHTVLF